MTASLSWSVEAKDYITYLCAQPGVTIVAHNAMFDIPRLRANGVTISDEVLDKRLFDSMWGAVVAQPDLHKGLGRAATVYLDLEPWKFESLKNADREWYGAKDAFVTAWLARQEIAVLKSLGMWNLFMGQGGHPGPGVMATLPELELMTAGGLKTDREWALWKSHYLVRRNLRYEKLWAR